MTYKIKQRVPLGLAIVLIAIIAMLVGTVPGAQAQTVAQDVAGSRPSPTLPLPTDLLWSMLAGFLAPLAGYVINKYGSQTKESVKLVVQTVVAAVAGGITQAIVVGGVGFNDTTFQYILFSVFVAGLGHQWWKAGGINVKLGASPQPIVAPTTTKTLN